MGWANLLQAGGTLISGLSAKSSANYNAAILKGEGQAAENSALVSEGISRRASREFLGRQSAAIGAAGIGYGGSAEAITDQSAVNAELDALNIRYKGTLAKAGYSAQAINESSAGTNKLTQSGLLAGADLLKSRAGYDLG